MGGEDIGGPRVTWRRTDVEKEPKKSTGEVKNLLISSKPCEMETICSSPIYPSGSKKLSQVWVGPENQPQVPGTLDGPWSPMHVLSRLRSLLLFRSRTGTGVFNVMKSLA